MLYKKIVQMPVDNKDEKFLIIASNENFIDHYCGEKMVEDPEHEFKGHRLAAIPLESKDLSLCCAGSEVEDNFLIFSKEWNANENIENWCCEFVENGVNGMSDVIFD